MSGVLGPRLSPRLQRQQNVDQDNSDFINHVASNHVASNHVASNHLVSNHVAQNHVVSNNVASNHVASNHVASNHVVSNNVAQNHVTSNHVISNHVTPNNHSILNNLPTIEESSNQEIPSPDHVLVSNHIEQMQEFAERVKLRELIEEQTVKLQKIMSIQEETMKILQLCSQKGKQPTQDRNIQSSINSHTFN